MKTLLIVALAAGAAAIPALAQTQAPAPQAYGAPLAPRAAAVHTRAEAAAKVRSTFARLDSNRDGFVTREEGKAQRAMMRQQRKSGVAGRAPGPRVADRGAAFDRLDANRDGSISRDEFTRAPAMRQRFVVRPDGARMGARRGMRMGAGMAGMGGRMFELADANRDSRVSLQEATDAALRRFDTADANRDGQVTRDERRQMRQRMRAERSRG